MPSREEKKGARTSMETTQPGSAPAGELLRRLPEASRRERDFVRRRHGHATCGSAPSRTSRRGSATRADTCAPTQSRGVMFCGRAHTRQGSDSHPSSRSHQLRHSPTLGGSLNPNFNP
eukprot:3074137-Rhodomonas_salina.1